MGRGREKHGKKKNINIIRFDDQSNDDVIFKTHEKPGGEKIFPQTSNLYVAYFSKTLYACITHIRIRILYMFILKCITTFTYTITNKSPVFMVSSNVNLYLLFPLDSILRSRPSHYPFSNHIELILHYKKKIKLSTWAYLNKEFLKNK